jgi:hypothetical protein
VDDASWAALALSLTVLGGIWTWFSFRRRGLASGLRALAFTLLPAAAYLTKTLRMFTEIADAITDWAARLVFSPSVWLGVMVTAAAAGLFVVSGWLRRRERARAPRATGAGEKRAEIARGRGTTARGPVDDPVDSEMAEIEALLRKRGIS